MEAAKQLSEKVGIVASCEALGIARSSYYSYYATSPRRKATVRKPSPRALTPEEREHVLAVLNSSRFMDKSPWEIYPALLDEGTYLCSISTMYRILRQNDQVRERRNQRRHPHYTKPELVATRPNQVWTWDVTRLPGPRTGVSYALYVALDLYSRYVVSWMLTTSENAADAHLFLEDSFKKYGIQAGELTLHSDRGAAMTSQSVGQLLESLGVNKSFNRPRTSNDNPYSESNFKTLKYHPGFSSRFETIEDARAYCRTFFTWYNEHHYHSGLGMLTPAKVFHDTAKEVIDARNKVLEQAYEKHPERFVRRPPTAPEPPEEVWINQPTEGTIELLSLTSTSAV